MTCQSDSSLQIFFQNKMASSLGGGGNQTQAFQASIVVTQGKILDFETNAFLKLIQDNLNFSIIANSQPQTQTVPSSSQQIRVQPQSQQVQVQQLQQQQQQQQQQFITLPGGQQVAVRMATTASATATAAAATAQPAAAAQVMQFPQTQQIQQMVPVQIPVSQNGQTVYQTGMSDFSVARYL